MAKTLLQNYLDWNDPGNLGKNLKSFIDILGDFYFTAPSIFFADHHAKSNSNTYMYRFTLNPSLRSLVYDPPEYPGKVGADHGDELPFVFGYPLLEEGLTPDASQVDKELSYDMIRYWTNFARFGIEMVSCKGAQNWKEQMRSLRIHQKAHVKVGEGLVDVYTNIPYAKPPVGELRFQHPELPEPWQGIRDGTVTPPACIQPISPEVSLLQDLTDVSEDCLYLRIHAPREENKTDLLPVLVFIDGKDFRHADGVHLDLSNLAAFGKMVVVTLNYRLGSLGFFSTGLNTDVTGNYGLGDIISALTWVQKNIANFGGDPERVTLGGQESGAISAHILLFVPQSEGLFHQMLSFGGSALQPSAVDYIEGRLEKVKTFIEDVGCPTLPYQAMMTCLYSKPAHVFATQNLTHMPDVNFGPVIDRVFITDDMTKLAEDKGSIMWTLCLATTKTT
ncbi:pyrethroid hydrolase Ces2e-like [Liolophura sinensis]|uniref:pyrethroid hydrolase Ces2e-like n=1 Tax=Liolophura sinensis TaxID=3198878 RepID=UPI003157F803